MSQRIAPPEAYIVARASLSDGGHWISDVLKVVHDTFGAGETVEIIDLEQVNTNGDMATLALKIASPMSSAAYAQLSINLDSVCRPGVEVRLLKGVRDADHILSLDDVVVEYFRREFAKDCREIVHKERCVRLTHLPTGCSVRSTAHRGKTANYDEAKFLLASLLA